jgi:hypothetical protein
MTITVGQLISTVFDAYDRSLGDEKLAAVATEIELSELLAHSSLARRRVRSHRRSR